MAIVGESKKRARCTIDIRITCGGAYRVSRGNGIIKESIVDVPAEKIDVAISALVRSGKTLIPIFFIAITYGLLAPVDVPTSESNMLLRVWSLYGRTMPTQSAPMMKNSPKRQYIVLKAVLIVLVG